VQEDDMGRSAKNNAVSSDNLIWAALASKRIDLDKWYIATSTTMGAAGSPIKQITVRRKCIMIQGATRYLMFYS
jgi:hypothetical protein